MGFRCPVRAPRPLRRNSRVILRISPPRRLERAAHRVSDWCFRVSLASPTCGLSAGSWFYSSRLHTAPVLSWRRIPGQLAEVSARAMRRWPCAAAVLRGCLVPTPDPRLLAGAWRQRRAAKSSMARVLLEVAMLARSPVVPSWLDRVAPSRSLARCPNRMDFDQFMVVAPAAAGAPPSRRPIRCPLISVRPPTLSVLGNPNDKEGGGCRRLARTARTARAEPVG